MNETEVLRGALRERIRLWEQEAETSIARTGSEIHAEVYRPCIFDIEAVLRQSLDSLQRKVTT